MQVEPVRSVQPAELIQERIAKLETVHEDRVSSRSEDHSSGAGHFERSSPDASFASSRRSLADGLRGPPGNRSASPTSLDIEARRRAAYDAVPRRSQVGLTDIVQADALMDSRAGSSEGGAAKGPRSGLCILQ